MSTTRQLNKAGIAAAALAIADAEGFAAVSMLLVAQELGAGTMRMSYCTRSDAGKKRLRPDALPELKKACGKVQKVSVQNRFDLGLEAIFDKFSERGHMGTARPRRHRRKSAK